MASIISFILMLISLTGLIIARLMENSLFIIVLKILTSVLFLTTAYFAQKECTRNNPSTYFKLMFTGLLFSLFGDIFLVFNQDNGMLFILGVASFAGAHIFYTAGFFQFGKFSKLNLIWTIIFIIFLQWLISLDNIISLGTMKPLVIGYSILISFMVGKSMTLWKFRKENPTFVTMTIAGAVLFLISDSLLLFAIFGKNDLHLLEALNNLIYYIGQGLFALSFRNELLLPKKN